jgi:hypothetical protein
MASSRATLESALASAQDRLVELIPTALDVIEELATDDQQPGAVRLNAAKDMLDRVGMTPKVRMELESKVTSDVDERVLDLVGQLQRNAEISAQRQAALAAAAREDEPEDAEVVVPEPEPDADLSPAPAKE